MLSGNLAIYAECILEMNRALQHGKTHLWRKGVQADNAGEAAKVQQHVGYDGEIKLSH